MAQVAEAGFMLLVQEMVTQFIPQSSDEGGESTTERDYSKLERIGFQVGVRIVERLTLEKPRFSDSLEAVKFICKDFWTAVFKKQVDNLKTNHKGVFVLTDNTFRWTSHISQASVTPAAGDGSAEAAVEEAAEAEHMLAPYVAFPCGVLRGALHNLGMPCVVTVDASHPPVCAFTLRLDTDEAA